MAEMPNINIAFKSTAATAVARGERGVILLVLRGAVPANNPVVVQTDADIPSNASTVNKEYIRLALKGNETAPRKVIAYFIGAEDDLEAVKTWVDCNRADYFVMPTVETDGLISEVKDWIINIKASHNNIKAVLPNCQANNEYIINYTTETVKVGDKTYTAEQFTPRIAGIICGTSLAHSVTYVTVPEATDCTRYTKTEMDSKVNAGQLFCFFDGQKVKLSRGVNSLTTFTTQKNNAFSKIKLVEVMNLIEGDLRTLCQDYYIGQFPNSYSNRCILLSAIEDYIETYVLDGTVSAYDCQFDVDAIKVAMAQSKIDYSSFTDEQIVQYDFGTSVFIALKVNLLDAIEDITINISI